MDAKTIDSTTKQPKMMFAGNDRDYYIKYLEADTAERKKIRKSEAVYWTWPGDNNDYYKTELNKFLKKIDQDPELTNWKYNWTEQDALSQSHRVLAQRIYKSAHGLDAATWSKKSEAALNKRKTNLHKRLLEKYLNVYVPPANRIRITKNITFNKEDIIPVYSDVPNETLSNLQLHDFFVYDYGDVNIVEKTKEVNLYKAMKLAEQEDNMIKCECTAANPCHGNKSCPCFRLNSKLQTFQLGERPTVFTSFEPILVSKTLNVIYDCVGFACSELCGCEGKCNNNSLLLSQKHVFPLEMYRSNPNIGFCIRSPVLIPAGTPFKTFTGEILQRSNIKEQSEDYCFEVWRHDEMRMNSLIEDETKFTAEYKKLLKDLFKWKYQIDPTTYGNVGRTAGHSCIPNVELLRVYQRSLSPAHVNLVMVASEDIFPGTPICIDYGEKFADRLKSVCGCGSFMCPNSKHAATFRNMEWPDISACLNHIHKIKFNEYMNTIRSKEKAQ